MTSAKTTALMSLLTMVILWVLISSHSWLTLCVIIALLLRVLYRTVLYPEVFTPLRAIPTPSGRSISRGHKGSSPATPRMSRLRHWKATVPNHGLIRIYQSNYQERLLVTSTKALSEILVSNVDNFAKPDFVRDRLFYVTGTGLLLAEGEEHRGQRKSLMPAFSFRHVKDLYPVFWSKARELTRCLRREVSASKSTETGAINIESWATSTTLDIIGLAGMDYDFGSLEDPNNSLNQQYKRLELKLSLWEMMLGTVLYLFSGQAEAIFWKLPTKSLKRIKEASLHIRTLCQKVIQEKKNKLEKAAAQNDVDIVAVALKSTVFSNKNLVDQMMTFLAAGHGTTSHALQWAVYALCEHDNIQTRLRQDIRDKLPSINDGQSTVSANDLDSIPYLQAFCNEVLRFYPSVPSTIRVALHDTTVAGYHIPKGTIFEISPGVVNHDPELWGPDAAVFDPERWMREGCANTGGVRNNYGFLTFLHGPRSCIGATFAKSELACLVAALVGTFRMELENPGKEAEYSKLGIGAGPVGGVRTKLEVLDGW